jgi:TatD DNase family protein
VRPASTTTTSTRRGRNSAPRSPASSLARGLDLPVVVHLREADADALAILRSEGARDCGGVIHCFSGDAASARAFLDLGLSLSFSGIVTFKNAEPLRGAARVVPGDRLMIETDAPFLAPIPFRGKRNEPALVARTAAVLAEVRGEPLQAFAEQTSRNTERLFRLG